MADAEARQSSELIRAEAELRQKEARRHQEHLKFQQLCAQTNVEQILREAASNLGTSFSRYPGEDKFKLEVPDALTGKDAHVSSFSHGFGENFLDLYFWTRNGRSDLLIEGDQHKVRRMSTRNVDNVSKFERELRRAMKTPKWRSFD